MTTCDHIIPGTGQATGTLPGRTIPTGDSITIPEEAKVGGSCVNYGCTPAKILVANDVCYPDKTRLGPSFTYLCSSLELIRKHFVCAFWPIQNLGGLCAAARKS